MIHMRKVLFLDFDGVMVTDRYQKVLMDANIPLRDDYGAKFDPVCGYKFPECHFAALVLIFLPSFLQV